MAILKVSTGTVRATVRVGDEIATEYADPDAADDDSPSYAGVTQTHCYIESRDDTNYVVCFSVDTEDFKPPDPLYTLSYDICVDGNRQAGGLCPMSDGISEFSCSGRKELIAGQLYLRKFQFAKVSTTDDQDRKPTKKTALAAKDIGTIKIEVNLLQTMEAVPWKVSRQERTKLDFHEKDLKGRAISHGTSFSPAVPTSYINEVLVDHIACIGLFVFKYRSRDALRQEMVIRPSQSPVVDDDDDEDQNAKDLVKQELPNVKQERKRPVEAIIDLTDDTEPRVYKAKKENGKLIFDLTED